MYRHIYLQYILTAFRQRLHPIRKVLIVATTVFDSALFRGMFGTAPMREVSDDRAYVARCIDAETALARAQAKAGLIPATAAAEITERASVDRIEFDALQAETEIVGDP